MNNTPVLFNKSTLGKFLASFTSSDIPDYKTKQGMMQGWKKSVESSDLSRTKEKSVQGKFLGNVFEEILGYTSFVGKTEWNQVAEMKSVLDSTEADGALGFFTKDTQIVRAVVELKDANTNLDKRQNRANNQSPVEQAFSYAHKQGSGCRWVIVTNFTELRLYHASSSLEYERFIITKLDKEEDFKRFYFLLCKDSLISKHGKSAIDKLYDANELARTEISNKFYSEYKSLRTDLFDALKSNNETIDQLTLFSKAQKILDRFLFICFCESTYLLPQGVFKQVIQCVKTSFLKSPNRLWSELKGLFHSIDKGNPPMHIGAYNGGLFAADSVLDGLTIPDNVLENFQKLTEYDFNSDLNVNILGHIFEHSLADIEQLKSQLEGAETKSKQKADGIFYTPNYVTKFVVEKTVGRWLTDEKSRIRERLFASGGFTAAGSKLGKRKVTLDNWDEAPSEETIKGEGRNQYYALLKLHEVFWEEYIRSLKSVKILDPACGSGAFLNCAFDYLTEEGIHAAEMHHYFMGNQMTIFDWDSHILQNNLYGVDINAESVEITKLSLWLKTARKDRELASLDDSIKCGNSIIDAPSIAPNAFNWNKAFPEIMNAGGFDVVIGNPPYGASLTQSEKNYITASYSTTEYNFDTYKTFMELGLKLTKPGGYMGYITPNTFFVLEKGANKLRRLLFENHTVLDIVELFNVFPTAVVEPCITVFKNTPPTDDEVLEVRTIPRKTDLVENSIADGVKTEFVQKDLRKSEGYVFKYRETEAEKRIVIKIWQSSKPLMEYFYVSAGVKPYEKGKGNPPQTAEIVKNKPFEGYEKHDECWKPYIRGSNVSRFIDTWDGEYIKYGEWLAAPRNSDMFENEKVFVRRTSDFLLASLDNKGKIGNNSIHCVYPKNSNASLKYLVALLNSKLLNWVFRYDNFHMVGKPFAEVKVVFVERLPIAISDDQQPIIELADKLLEACQSSHDKAKAFMDYIKTMHKPAKLTEKLNDFNKHDFLTFANELKKQKVKLTPKQEMELMPLFNEKQAELTSLSQRIFKLDSEMDEKIYELYGITEDERKIMEQLRYTHDGKHLPKFY